MLDWMKGWTRRPSIAPDLREARQEAAAPPERPMTGAYLLLYKYLKNRYADTVVLTLAEIEDLLGFTLPDQARVCREWWTDEASASHSDSWRLAHRRAVPNLVATTVLFERDASYA